MHLGTTRAEWAAFSDEQRFEHVDVLLQHFCRYTEQWETVRSIPNDILFIDPQIFENVVHSYYEDVARMEKSIDGGGIPSDFKQKAMYAFWIAKLKPISVSRESELLTDNIRSTVNESIALNIALEELDCILDEEIGATADLVLVDDIITVLRYKPLSPHALYLVLSALYHPSGHFSTAHAGA